MRCVCALLLATALGGVGCRPAEAEGYFGTTDRSSDDPATFYLNNYDEPETLDPSLATDRAATSLLNELFEGLTVLHPEDLRPTPGVATRWDRSEDNRLYRFHLRPDARWSDGKPVTAADFVYAWRRVLTPKTAARMATMMHRFKNGKLYHQSKLKRLRSAENARATPQDGAPAGESLPAGATVRLLMTSPVEIRTAIAPLAEPAGAVSEVRYRKPPKGKPEAERLELGAGAPSLRPAADGGWAKKRAQILERGPAVKCNGGPDHWYRLRVGDAQGYLPGCALRERAAKADWALVVRHDEVPTFRPRPPSPAEGDSPPDGSETDADAQPPLPAGWVPMASLFADPTVIGFRATGDHILEVELEEPTPYFLQLCSYPTFFPVRRDVIERFAASGRPDHWYRPENIVVNGPYTLESWTFRYEIRMKRNPHYHGREKLKVHHIVWLEVADHHANMNLYKAGEIDYIGANVSLPAAYMKRLSRLGDFHRSKYLATYWYELNVNRPPLDDVRVRQALNLAVNKQQLVQAVTRSGQEPATHYVPDFTGSGYAAQARADQEEGRDPFRGAGYDFDPERARALLTEAGYEVIRKGDGYQAQGFEALEILYNTSEGHRKIAVTIQDMWKRHLGITVSLRNEEWKVMLKSIQSGKYQVARAGWSADYNHPHTWLETFLSYSAQNWSGWKSRELDALVEQAAATADPETSIRLYRQAEKLAVDEMPRIPMYFFTKSTLVKPYVKGFYRNAKNEHQVRFMWIDPAWKRDAQNRPSFAIERFPPPGTIDP